MQRAVNARDAGLQKVRQLDRWMIGAAVGLTLVFSAAAASAFKGHARHGAPAPAAVSPPSSGGDPNAGAADPNATGADPNAAGIPDQSQQVPVVPNPVVTGSS